MDEWLPANIRVATKDLDRVAWVPLLEDNGESVRIDSVAFVPTGTIPNEDHLLPGVVD